MPLYCFRNVSTGVVEDREYKFGEAPEVGTVQDGWERIFSPSHFLEAGKRDSHIAYQISARQYPDVPHTSKDGRFGAFTTVRERTEFTARHPEWRFEVE